MELYQKFFAAANESRHGGPHNWQHDTPYRQPYYTYSAADQRWYGIFPPSKPPHSSEGDTTTTTTRTTTTTASSPNPQPITTFTIYSWNIDFMLPHGDQRLTAALTHLLSLLTTNANDSAKPSIIFLQEMTNADLRVLQAQPWIQQNYDLTDVTNEYWESTAFGTCTLIPKKAVRVRDVFRVHYRETVMQRDGLFVDVDVDVGSDVQGGTQQRCLRLCNTHMESLALEPPRRPAQMKCAARFMRGGDGGAEKDGPGASVEVVASVLGGDLNAVQPFDRTIAAENGLEDAYLAAGGEEGREDCFTWGQMARTAERSRFGLCRMDKLLFCGQVKVENFERFGMGVEVEGELERQDLISQGLEKPWVTDHLGVKGDFCLYKSWVHDV